MLLADEESARKSPAAWRVVPLVRPLLARLRLEWSEKGFPAGGRVCPPRQRSRSGMVSLTQMHKRVRRVWLDLGLEPIGFQDSRHTAATWLDHAGVSPKFASVLMGHRVPRHHFDAAPITLARYTHVLPGERERARDQLDAFLAEREEEQEPPINVIKKGAISPSAFPSSLAENSPGSVAPKKGW
jgi:integrase